MTVRERVAEAGTRIPRHTAVARERSYRSDVASPGSVRREAIEPVVGDFDVAVQYDGIAIPMQRAVDRRRKALPRGLLQKRDPFPIALLTQPADELRFRTRIVDDDEFELCLLREREHALDAPPYRFETSIDRNDDVQGHCDRPPIAAGCRIRRRNRPSGHRNQPCHDSRYRKRATDSVMVAAARARSCCASASCASNATSLPRSASSRCRALARSLTATIASCRRCSAILRASSTSQYECFSASNARS